MEIKLSDKEKQLFEKIQSIRDFCNDSHTLSEEYLDHLMIKNILCNRFSKKAIKPVNGAFDALADDVDCYLKQSFEEFVEFLFDYMHLREKS
ncbi:MAG: hypothetical protein IME96_05405 [Proteobacteria bacterium]|nr:hypothetical protein [Pseudomonadota bacterium]